MNDLEIREKKLIEDLKEKHCEMFTYISGFITREKSCVFKCNQCGNEFTCNPKTLLRNNRVGCKHCYGNKRNHHNIINEKEFLTKFNRRYKGKFVFIGPYNGYDKETTFLHPECGNEFISKPENFMSKTIKKYCIKCSNNRSYDYSYVKNYIEESGEYELISKEYKNNKEYLEIKHLECNHIFKMKFNQFSSNGNRCPLCYGHIRFPKEDFLKEFNLKNNENEYIILSEYESLTKPLKVKHLTCGHEYELKEARQSIKWGLKCPECYPSISRGSLEVKLFLSKNNIQYEIEKTFNDLKYINNLYYDYFIPEFNLFIEYDGSQHFMPGFKKTKEEFELTKIRDNLKNEYIKNHKEYSLLRITYKDSPEQVLNDFFFNNIIDDKIFFIESENIILA